MPRIVFGLLLAAYAGALVYLAHHTGVTVDEPSHLLSARLYWTGSDTLAPRDMPPLIKIAGGWPARFFFPLPDLRQDAAAWTRQHEWQLALTMMRLTPPARIGPLYFASRLPLLIFPLATAALLFIWGCRLFPPWIAVALAALWMLEPTALGHGALFKNDHAAAFAYLLFGFLLWRFWSEPTTRSAGLLGFGLLLALLSKLSMFFLVPVVIALVLLRTRRLLPLATLLAVAYLGLLAACQFELTPRAWIPFPKPIWDGLKSVAEYNQSANSVWLNGMVHPQGNRAYFLLALLWKSPLALLASIVLAWGIALRRRIPEAAFVILPSLTYVALASLSPLQFGFRLILPALPFAILSLGFLFARWRPLAPLTLALVAASSAPAFPDSLSYFNELSRTPPRRLHRLSDSNIDWGQGLPALRDYIRQEQVTFFRLVYFGNDIATRYFGLDDFKHVALPWDDAAAAGQLRYQPKPGLYAVSPSAMTGQFYRAKYRNYFECFRSRPPDAVLAGGAIWIYIVDFTNPTPLPPSSAP